MKEKSSYFEKINNYFIYLFQETAACLQTESSDGWERVIKRPHPCSWIRLFSFFWQKKLKLWVFRVKYEIKSFTESDWKGKREKIKRNENNSALVPLSVNQLCSVKEKEWKRMRIRMKDDLRGETAPGPGRPCAYWACPMSGRHWGVLDP